MLWFSRWCSFQITSWLNISVAIIIGSAAITSILINYIPTTTETHYLSTPHCLQLNLANSCWHTVLIYHCRSLWGFQGNSPRLIALLILKIIVKTSCFNCKYKYMQHLILKQIPQSNVSITMISQIVDGF